MTNAALDFSSPLLVPLQVFNLLPSRTLHAERARAFWPEDAEHAPLLQHESVERALHRQRSAELLQSLGEHAQPVDDLAHAELPLALAAPPLLAQLARLSGVMLMGSMLRRTIARDHVAHAKQVLGAEVFHWAQGDAEALHPGLDDAQLRPWLGEDLHASAVALGSDSSPMPGMKRPHRFVCAPTGSCLRKRKPKNCAQPAALRRMPHAMCASH